MDFVKPFNALGFLFKQKEKQFNACVNPFANHLQSAYFHPFNGKPLVSVFAFHMSQLLVPREKASVIFLRIFKFSKTKWREILRFKEKI